MMNKHFTTRNIVAVAIGAALFGILMTYGGIPVFTNTKLSTAYIVPIVVGALFGPVQAALVGLIGNVFADALGGSGFWLDWTVGNMFACFFIGALKLYGADIRRGIFTVKHAVIYALVSVVGLELSFGLITPLLTKVLYGGELATTITQAQVAVLTNAIVVLVVGIPLLFTLAKRYRGTRNLVDED